MTGRKKMKILFLFSFVLILLCLSRSVEGGLGNNPDDLYYSPLFIRVIVERQALIYYTDVNRYEYSVQIGNYHDAPISFSPYFTPFEGYFYDMFDYAPFNAEKPDESPEYIGAVKRRKFPLTREELITLQPSEVRTFSVDVTKSYYYPQPNGAYRASFHVPVDILYDETILQYNTKQKILDNPNYHLTTFNPCDNPEEGLKFMRYRIWSGATLFKVIYTDEYDRDMAISRVLDFHRDQQNNGKENNNNEIDEGDDKQVDSKNNNNNNNIEFPSASRRVEEPREEDVVINVII